MKLCDWAFIFGVLFLGAIALFGLRTSYFMQAQFTTEAYNRIIDKAAEDCLMDVVKQEYEDGSVRIDGQMAERHFYEQLFFVFDTTGQEERKALQSGVRMMKLLNQKEELTMEETERIRLEMEQETNKKYERDAALFSFYFPYIEEEDWYARLEKRGMYIFYDVPDGYGQSYNRFLFSGSKIKKAS